MRIPSIAALVSLAVLCIASFLLMFYASSNEAAIMDELAHIPAGYSYVSQFDFRLNPEHPPLVKMLAGIPLLFMDVSFPTDNPAWTTAVNGQWDMGREFLYRSGNDADAIVQNSRIGAMLLTLALIVVTYVFAREIVGMLWALVPALLVGLSPHVLAHGHFVTTDIAAAFGVVIATHFYLKTLANGSRASIFFAGIAFGVAQAGKFSAVLLFPYFIFLAFMHALTTTAHRTNAASFRDSFILFIPVFGKRVLSLAAVFVIAYALIIYPLYFLFTINYPIDQQVRDTAANLITFAGGPGPEGEFCSPGRCIAEFNVWLAQYPLTRPLAEYMLGVLMVLQRSAGGNTIYFLGQVYNLGWRYYFPVVYSLKEPLPFLALLSVAIGGGVVYAYRKFRAARGARFRRFFNYLGTHFPEFSMLVFVIMYWIYSINSPLNIGFRHLFPTLPFIYILTASYWKRWITGITVPAGKPALATFLAGVKAVFASSLKYVALILLLTWYVLEAIIAAPFYLSYFNQLGGGTASGYRYVTDSNYDWGQDLVRLKQFVDAHPEIDRIGVDYFGGGDTRYYLGEKAENWWSARGNPTQEGIHYLAVSVNTLQGATQKLVPGFTRNPDDEYRWLTELRPPGAGMGALPEPDYRVGTSFFVYAFP